MNKQALKSRRAALLQTLAQLKPGTHNHAQREQIQADITAVNTMLKEVHITEAREAKEAADVRRAAGQAEQFANLARVGGKAKIRPGGFDAVVVDEAQHVTKEQFDLLTDEGCDRFLLDRGKQMLDILKGMHARRAYVMSFRITLESFLREHAKWVEELAMPTKVELTEAQHIALELARVTPNPGILPRRGQRQMFDALVSSGLLFTHYNKQVTFYAITPAGLAALGPPR